MLKNVKITRQNVTLALKTLETPVMFIMTGSVVLLKMKIMVLKNIVVLHLLPLPPRRPEQRQKIIMLNVNLGRLGVTMAQTTTVINIIVACVIMMMILYQRSSRSPSAPAT